MSYQRSTHTHGNVTRTLIVCTRGRFRPRLEIERSVARVKRRHAAPCFLSGGQVIRIRSYQHERARGTESQSGVYPVPVRAPPRSTYSRVEGQVPRCFCLSVWDRCLGHLLTRTAAGATGVRQNVTSRYGRRGLRNYSAIVFAKFDACRES